MAQPEEAVRRSTRVLSAFMSPNEAANYSAQTLDPLSFLVAWQGQAGAAAALPQEYAPAKLDALSSRGQRHSSLITANPIFKAVYGPTAKIQMVELGRLIAFQWHVDSVVSDAVHGATLTATPSEEDVLNTCLPPEIVGPAPTLWQGIQKRPGNAIGSVVASSTDLTFDMANGFPQWDASTGQIAIVLSSNSNLMLVRQHGDRLALANGYHRAAALRARGVEMAPAVVVQVASTAAIVPGPGFFQEPIVTSARPPLVDDFQNDALALTVDVRAMMKVVRVTVESLLVPRML
jgi:hypothetical protein